MTTTDDLPATSTADAPADAATPSDAACPCSHATAPSGSAASTVPTVTDDQRTPRHDLPALRARGRRNRQVRDGLADLDERCPDLADLLDTLSAIDALAADAIDRLGELQTTGEVEDATGLPLSLWLSIGGRRTRSDLRMLETAADQLPRRLPTLDAAFRAGQVSWAQVRAVLLEILGIPRSFDDRIDAAIAKALTSPGLEPDVLASTVGWVLAVAEPDERPSTPDAAPEHDVVAMQPRLDGSGGRLFGDFGPEGFATLDAHLNVGAPAPAGRARDHLGEAGDPERVRELGAQAGRRRARRLLDLLEAGAIAEALGGAAGAGGVDAEAAGVAGTGGVTGAAGAGGAAEFAGAGGAGGVDARTAGPADTARPSKLPATLLVRMELSTLLGGDLPADLLTTLLGGRMKVDAATARRIAEERGAALRTIVVDDTGAVVGVGRRTRVPPGWMRDAALAVHDHCSAPRCRTAARICDLDHAEPWWPTDDRADRAGAGGATDVANIAPVCRTDNRVKERDGWQARGDPDGSRTWEHPRSGLTVRTVPATWRPASRDGPDQ